MPLDRLVSTLSIGERQLVEIARGVGYNCYLLVLDEPTAALTHEETDLLFTVVRRLCAAGTAILFISHKLDEIEELADEVTVLRDGRSVIDCEPVKELSRSAIIRAMIGGDVSTSGRAALKPGAIVLRARGVTLSPSARPLNLDVRSGEIVGITGLVGSGVLSIGAALAGASTMASGTIAVDSNIIPAGNRAKAVAAGIGYVPGDRQVEGLFPLLSAVKNVSASTLRKHANVGVLSSQAEWQSALPLLTRLGLYPLRPDLEARSFSGGNQQKLLICRNLSLEPLRVLVVLEPTRGVDIGAREMIHDALVASAARGVAIVLASSDIEEVLALSDRIFVIRHGDLTDEVERGVERSVLMDLLAGRTAP